ncbi:MAG: OmpH family outer membrane protein, partial [Alistipes sp.]|nr:OmpH family outer membrane protein [Alistipes sp.]
MKRFIFALLALLMCGGVVSAQNYIVVNSEQIFRSISDYNIAMTTLDNLAKEYQAKVDEAYKDIESLYNSYMSQKQDLSTSARNAKEQEILSREKAVAEYPVDPRYIEMIESLDSYVIKKFRVAFGNRIIKQLKIFVPVYVACGGDVL